MGEARTGGTRLGRRPRQPCTRQPKRRRSPCPPDRPTAHTQEVRTWMDAPGNDKEFVMLYFDDQANLATWVGLDGHVVCCVF